MTVAELVLHEHAGSATRADIIAVVKGRDVEFVDTRTRRDELL